MIKIKDYMNKQVTNPIPLYFIIYATNCDCRNIVCCIRYINNDK